MYGRPPARWLISESLKKHKTEATFREIASATKTPILAVRRLSELYAAFLKLEYDVETTTRLSNAFVNVKRLAYLHAILSADRLVRIQIGRLKAGHPHSLAEAFGRLLLAARKSGLRTTIKAPRNPKRIEEYRQMLLDRLKIPY